MSYLQIRYVNIMQALFQELIGQIRFKHWIHFCYYVIILIRVYWKPLITYAKVNS